MIDIRGNLLKRIFVVALAYALLAAGLALTAPGQSAARKKQPVRYTIKLNTIMHVRLDQELDSERARVGDSFTSTLVDPVYSAGGVLLIPQGSTIAGRVTNVSRAAKNGKPATLDVQFTSVRLPNGYRNAINGSLTDLSSSGGKRNYEGTVTANTTSHRNAKFIGGGAGGGAIIGAIAAGGKGLAIGAGVGALTGGIAGRLKKGSEVKVKRGTEFGVILNQSISLTRYRAA